MNFLFLYQHRMLRRERLIRDRLNPLEFYDEIEIKALFRLERETILDIVEQLHPRLQYNSSRNSGLTTIQQVCLALHFYGSGCLQLSLGAIMHVDQSTASRTCWRVTQAICGVFRNTISIPSDLNSSKDAFYVRHGFVNTFGCIDCTHVEIKAPGRHHFPDEYINRKGWYSINVQAICDVNCHFIDVEARWPGSVHDSRIFKNSDIAKRLLRRDVNGILLGDSGYSLTPFLLVPYSNASTSIQENFNRRHRSTRVLIECSFGQVKQRFSCLQSCLKIKLSRIPKTILACFILHNICNERNDEVPAATGSVHLQLQPNAISFVEVENSALRRLGEQKRDEMAVYLKA